MCDGALRDQTELHRRLGFEKNILKKSQLRAEKQCFSALMILLSRYEARKRGEVVIEDIDFLRPTWLLRRRQFVMITGTIIFAYTASY